MSHRIAEAIIENGQIKYIDKKLPPKKLKVHIIYDDEKAISANKITKIMKETFGVYKNMKFDADMESKRIRQEWERKFDQ